MNCFLKTAREVPMKIILVGGVGHIIWLWAELLSYDEDFDVKSCWASVC